MNFIGPVALTLGLRPGGASTWCRAQPGPDDLEPLVDVIPDGPRRPFDVPACVDAGDHGSQCGRGGLAVTSPATTSCDHFVRSLVSTTGSGLVFLAD
jgi:hypothetical protein